MFVRGLVIGLSTILVFICAISPCAAASPTGGGEFSFSSQDAPNSEQYQAIFQQLKRFSSTTTATKSNVRQAGSEPIQFNWPLRAVPWSKDFNYYGYSNFVDHDALNPGFLLDYNCGARTYDVDAYDHRGSDIFLWPFPWNKMSDNEVEVVAAAPGTILLKTDGNDDKSCTYTGKDWNAVYIEHADSSVAWYGHFKKDSLLSKDVGDSISAGEYLGIVGSSGSSSIPHLHFEVYDAQNNLIDPFAGQCNSLNTDSWWREQPSYFASSVNRLTVGTSAAKLGLCPSLAEPNEKNTIVANESAYFTAYLSGQRNVDEADYSLRSADGSLIERWQHSSPEPLYNASYWYWEYSDLALRGGYGVWEFSVNYLNKDYVKRFNLIPDCENIEESVDSVQLDLEEFCRQEIPDLELPSNEWHQIALPAEAGAASSVLDLFGDDLSPRGYGLDWVVFHYNPVDRSYKRLGIMEQLDQGSGYWMIQVTGETVTLTLTDHIPRNLSGVEVLLSPQLDVSWQMLGFSGAKSSILGDVFKFFNSENCSQLEGCSITKAVDDALIYPIVFSFNGNEYEQLGAGSSIEPWTAVWIAVLPGASQSSVRIRTQ